MCTAVCLKPGSLYFGRNLDLDYAYDVAVTIVPRFFPLGFLGLAENHTFDRHLAIAGMAYTPEDYPLFYDGFNEKGLCMAGLNFPGFAHYLPEKEGMFNIAPCEFIPWILSQCETAGQAAQLILKTNLTDAVYSKSLPNTPLHWMISGRDGTIVAEPSESGLIVRDNAVGVLANSPPFDWHMLNLARYMHLSALPAENRMAASLPLSAFSRGMGASGLPGDLSSPSRFVRAAFAVQNSECSKREEDAVSQVFHILHTVEHPRGSVNLGKGRQQITLYSSCMSASKGIYYYNTYENSRITAVCMAREDLNGRSLIRYPLRTSGDILFEN